MSLSPEQRWSQEHRKQFSEHYVTMRGLVRREVARKNLHRQLEHFWEFPHRVMDVGGGVGDDARWLADLRQEVVLIDTDPESIKEAARFSYPMLDELLVGDSGVALDRFGPGSFDLVLSHGVLLYHNSPKEELRRLASLVRPGGYLSLLTAGKFGKLKRYEASGQTAAVRRLELTGTYINNLGLEAQAYLPQEINSMLESAGLETQNWFGVRVYSDNDGRDVNLVPAFHRNRILNDELIASRDPVLRPSAQLLHYIARKNT